MPHVEVEPGVRLHVQDVGAGRPVVLVAGFGLSHEVWDREVRELGEAGFRAVCVDLRGSGLSDKPMGDHSIERHSRDVQAVLEDLDLRDATLVGWSFGGQVCFHLAATAPERAAQLVLVCSNAVRASRSDEFPFGAPADKLIPALVAAERGDRLRSRRQTIASGFAGEPDPDTVAFLVRVQLQMPSWAAVAWYEAYLRTDLSSLLSDVSMPVLQIVGSADPVTGLDGARWLESRLADSRIVELPECGHYPMFERGKAFDAALLGFVRER